jgi:hypothetical protein
VTVLFSDVTESTVLGEELDPESLRRLMARYFHEMQAVVRRHGGTTEKFIGDAVMAVFGVPRLHEDDALRAVRAAVDMREALHQLNDEFERVWGVRILAHMGVTKGYGSSWIFEPHLTWANVLGPVQHLGFSLVIRERSSRETPRVASGLWWGMR